MKKKYVLVTTEKRGVFAGHLESRDGDTAILSDCRMCVYWSSDVQGVMGLAAGGPTGDCRISKAAPRAELSGVTMVADCTDEARKAWESQPWS